MSVARTVLLTGLLALGLARGAAAQYYELFEPKTLPYKVGDTLVFRGKLTGVEQMSPVDPAPKLAQPLPDGVRLVRADSLKRITNGHYEGLIVFQFFRPGRFEVPQLVLRVRNLGADPGRIIAAVSSKFDIEPTIPAAGEPRPEDIRPAIDTGPPLWPFIGAGALASLVLAWLVSRWMAARQRARLAEPAREPMLAPADARSAALARLSALEAQGLARTGDVARHYSETIDVLRDFLFAMRRAPRARAATEEMLAAVAAAAGVPAHMASLLIEADFVKFAAVRPDAEGAERFLHAARTMVEQFDAADAIR